MKPRDELFKLIKSLNKAEKGYFKKFTGIYSDKEDKNYLQLFDLLDSQKVYDESQVKAEFGDTAFGKFLGANKAYLFRLILKSLRNFHSDNSVETQVSEMIREVEILYRKGLLAEADRHARKAMDKAVPQELFYLILNLFYWRSRISISRGYHDMTPEEIQSFFTAWKSWSDKLTNAIEYDSLSTAFYYRLKVVGYPFNEEEKEGYRIWLDNPYLRDISLAQTLRAKIKFYNVRTALLTVLEREKEAYELTQEYSTLFEENPVFLENNYSFYVPVLEKLVFLASTQKRYDEMFKQNEKLRELIEKTGNRGNLDYLLFYYALRMSWHFKTRNFNVTADVLDAIRRDTPFATGEADLLKEFQLWLDLTILDGVHGNWKEVFRNSRDLLELPGDSKTHEQQYMLRLMYLLACYKLGEWELFQSRLRSVKRDPRLNRELSSREEAVLRFLSKLPSHQQQPRRDALIRAHLEEIRDYVPKYKGEDNLDDLLWVDFMKAELEGKTVAELG